MTRAVAALAAALVLLLAIVVGRPAQERDAEPGPVDPTATTRSAVAAEVATGVTAGFIYGRITDVDNETYEGRLRWGRDQEAFWDDYFNGAKNDNPWTAEAALTQRPEDRSRLEVFGIQFGGRPLNLRRPFMARFGDIARIDAHLRTVDVTLKSGSSFVLDRFGAGDIDDGVRVWDGNRGVIDIDARRIRAIELLPTAPLADAPNRLHGTVRTRQGDFTGFILWDQQDCVGADELNGRTDEGPVNLRYDTIRSIVRRTRNSAVVSLLDGREMVLSDNRDVGQGNRGISVDDPRYGRVRFSWDAFERVDFGPGEAGPGYADFPPGRALTGTVTTRDGRRLAGRLVYDFDESETTETLDAARDGVDYTIAFNLIASIAVGRDGRDSQRATVTLHDGHKLEFERTGDLADGNAGMLIFLEGRERPDFIAWADIQQIDLDRVSRASPPPDKRYENESDRR